MTRQTSAYICALAAVLLWSTVAAAFKVTFRYTDFVTMLWYASLVSMTILFGIILVQRKAARLRRLTKAQLLRSLAGGMLNPFLYYLVLFKAYSVLPAQEAQPLNYTWPVVIALLAVPVLGDRLSARSLGALLVSFSGVVVISTRGDIFGLRFADPLGAALAVGSSFIWAAFWLLNVKDDRDPVVKLFLNFVSGAAFLSVAIIMLARAGIETGRIHVPETVAAAAPGIYTFPPRIGPAGFLGSLYVGCFEMGFTFVLWLNALSLTRHTAKVSNLILLSPFVSLLFIRFVAGERILLSSVMGLILIVAGVLIQRSAD